MLLRKARGLISVTRSEFAIIIVKETRKKGMYISKHHPFKGDILKALIYIYLCSCRLLKVT